jgi:hypothetical protein
VGKLQAGQFRGVMECGGQIRPPSCCAKYVSLEHEARKWPASWRGGSFRLYEQKDNYSGALSVLVGFA